MTAQFLPRVGGWVVVPRWRIQEEESGMLQGGVDKEENELDFEIVAFGSPVS